MNFINEEMERQVLSAMMLSDDERVTALSILPNLDVFQNEQHKNIARAIQAQHDAGEQVSLETVVMTLKKSALIKEAGGVKNVASVFASLKSPGHVEVHCRILIEQYMRTKFYYLAHEMASKAIQNQVTFLRPLQTSRIKLTACSHQA
jgi:replicative DNA helicase